MQNNSINKNNKEINKKVPHNHINLNNQNIHNNVFVDYSEPLESIVKTNKTYYLYKNNNIKNRMKSKNSNSGAN